VAALAAARLLIGFGFVAAPAEIRDGDAVPVHRVGPAPARRPPSPRQHRLDDLDAGGAR
jgi:hypothetical protein